MSSLPDKVATALALASAHPHDFTLQYPIRREFFMDTYPSPSTDMLPHLEATLPRPPNSPPLLLYVHVPFCESKCSYCNFAVDTRDSSNLHAAYVAGLEKQIHALYATLNLESGSADAALGGIDIGGGTPTLLDKNLLKRVLTALDGWRSACGVDAPLSIETTPHIASTEPDKMDMLVAHGVDRVSMGLQSSSAEMLRAVNRGKQVDAPARAAEVLHAAGFARFSVDVIFGLPGQGMDLWEADLDLALSLSPDAITAYDCLYRGKGRAMTARTTALPDWSTDYGPMYDFAYTKLTSAGYVAPYGSLNFSRHSAESGTSSYFEARLTQSAPYIGLGNYATSLLGSPLDTWAFAPYTVDGYLDGLSRSPFPVDFAYTLPPEELMAKHALLALSFGVLNEAYFASAFPGHSLQSVYGAELAAAVDLNLLTYDRDRGVYGVVEFASMPSLRALFHTASSLGWFQSTLYSPRRRKRRRRTPKAAATPKAAVAPKAAATPKAAVAPEQSDG